MITWLFSLEINDFNSNCSPAGSFPFLVCGLAAKKCSSQSGSGGQNTKIIPIIQHYNSRHLWESKAACKNMFIFFQTSGVIRQKVGVLKHSCCWRLALVLGGWPQARKPQGQDELPCINVSLSISPVRVEHSLSKTFQQIIDHVWFSLAPTQRLRSSVSCRPTLISGWRRWGVRPPKRGTAHILYTYPIQTHRRDP